MTRGNQRDLAREKSAKKTASKGERKDNIPPAKRKEHDAAALQAKLAAKKAAAEQSADKK
ncbi:hypothetical protein BATDEDRAFT_91079 [Batrachochytrium dendrobatidis JAM81]|uniref:Small EDRK-rich factor-like N-terminal domain-containing protein n=2 Tax=Batrachochytrium dendrobatidis TaxID=109871 RepID=F4P9S2_BATDJ|nr:uncharacterized protein BATDEDRAFT_91079 [Batrachochytrium dendrobatidis JAM81]EGF77966.1 hypothetical protein BATDEDRAFT_91079 [Batrachochytrium dendrobatidis JAM81]KAJ8330240.1 hypothetical protein O5D80_001808 [Batrachochytrium dendrobatidis]KAK5670338.1 hypothetical protein QVD99_003032 [Batrachochytrium dendrobatidis]OAJ43948.1 hypothetical protein BDEG_27259 [Batrachochytrium dendrobatidis JEL423]|eukprot:XP_006681531.1 hypothetical protein BATDEDRAFT_91079 [Batrachochytrium dendrobatidis JAM81]